MQDIDSQHAGLHDCYNDLLWAMAAGKGEKVNLSPILVGLHSYIDSHFCTEETLMRMIGYPEYEQHRKEHADFNETLDELCCRLGNGTAKVAELAELLKTWLTEHLPETDARLVSYYEHYRRVLDRTWGLPSPGARGSAAETGARSAN